MSIVKGEVSSQHAGAGRPRHGLRGAANETVVVVDDGGRVVSVNPDFERTAGYSRYEVLGKPVVELQDGERDPLFFRLIDDAVRSRRVCTEVVGCRRGEGRPARESATVYPLCDALGRVTGCVAIKHPLVPTAAM